jgi:hypothetical protein
MKFFRRLAGILAVLFHATAALYYLAISPPLHFFYEIAPPAGSNSVYVPGEPCPSFSKSAGGSDVPIFSCCEIRMHYSYRTGTPGYLGSLLTFYLLLVYHA